MNSHILVDDRIVRELATARAGRRLENELTYVPDLRSAIADCRSKGDPALRGAIALWISTLAGRVNRSVDQRLLIPHVLREALRLVKQNVILTTDGELYIAFGRAKFELLYTPNAS